MRKQKKPLIFPYRLAQLALLLVISFAAGRMLVFAQTWQFPASQPPQTNPGQPPAAGTGFLIKSPTTLQTVQKQIEAANASSVATALGGINGTIAVSAKNAFANPVFPTGKIGIFGYAAGTEYGIFGYAAGTGAAYGVIGKTGASGLAGQFEGAVRVIDNGTALGTLLVDDVVTAGQGLNCSDALGCALLAGMTGLTGTHSAAGKAVYGNSTTLAGISASIDHASIEGGKPVEARATYGYGIAGFGADGIYSKALGSVVGAAYTGIAGYAETPDTPDGKRSRSGVYGLSDGGLGNAIGYTTNPPNYDLAAGVRACVKNDAGTIQNKNGIKGTGGKFAGYFDGAPGSCTITDATIVDANNANFYGDQAVGPDGKPALAYFASGLNDLRVTRCARADCVGSPCYNCANPPSNQNVIMSIDAAAASGYSPSIAVPADNKPVVAYAVDSGSATGPLKILKCSTPLCNDTATNKITQVYDSGVDRGGRSSMALDSNGYPSVVFTDGDLQFLKCRTLDCSDETAGSPTANIIRTLAGNNTVPPNGTPYHPSITIPPDGNPVISFYEFGGKDLVVVKCGDPTCDTTNANFRSTIVDASGGGEDLGAFSDIAFKPGTSIPVVSYHRTNDVALLTCGDEDCYPTTGNQITLITEADPFFARTSLIIPSHGNPRIAFSEIEAADDDARYVVCHNPSCSSRNTIQPDLDAGDEGHDMALVLHPSGAVSLSYFIADVYDLKVLYCNNDFCAPQACTPPATDGGQVLIAGTGSVNPAKGAVLRIGNVYLTRCNLIGLLRKAGYTQYPAC